jgi:hypothetical protein
MHPVPLGKLRNRRILRSASSATLASDAASNFLRDFVILLAPSVKTEQDESRTEQDVAHIDRWS